MFDVALCLLVGSLHCLIVNNSAVEAEAAHSNLRRVCKVSNLHIEMHWLVNKCTTLDLVTTVSALVT